jgi:mono/diheme cytochrome c family protein
MSRLRLSLGTAVVLAGLVGLVVAVAGVQRTPSPGPRDTSAAPRSSGHAAHGTPKGWKFTWPKGDAGQGREVFEKLECYACHEVRGEKFPAPTEKDKVGPELSQMGPLHEAEYFAEAIINPSAVIEKGKGYQASDGSSKMPSFSDSMTVEEAIDLVAFLRSLKPAAEHPKGHRTH